MGSNCSSCSGFGCSSDCNAGCYGCRGGCIGCTSCAGCTSCTGTCSGGCTSCSGSCTVSAIMVICYFLNYLIIGETDAHSSSWCDFKRLYRS